MCVMLPYLRIGYRITITQLQRHTTAANTHAQGVEAKKLLSRRSQSEYNKVVKNKQKTSKQNTLILTMYVL